MDRCDDAENTTPGIKSCFAKAWQMHRSMGGKGVQWWWEKRVNVSRLVGREACWGASSPRPYMCRYAWKPVWGNGGGEEEGEGGVWGVNQGYICIAWRGVGGCLEGGVRIPVAPLSPCLYWPLLTNDTSSHRSFQPYFSLLSSQSTQHRQDSAAASKLRAASCISAEPLD